MKQPELKPCPFCGGMGIFVYHKYNYVAVQCFDCGARTSYFAFLEGIPTNETVAKADAAERWNRREE